MRARLCVLLSVLAILATATPSRDWAMAADERAWWCALFDDAANTVYYSDAFQGDADGALKYSDAFLKHVDATYHVKSARAHYCQYPLSDPNSLGAARADRDSDVSQSKKLGRKIVMTGWTY